MILFAQPLSTYWLTETLPKEQRFIGMVWSDWHQSMALNIRFIGCLLFIAGIAERIIIEVKQIKKSN